MTTIETSTEDLFNQLISRLEKELECRETRTGKFVHTAKERLKIRQDATLLHSLMGQHTEYGLTKECEHILNVSRKQTPQDYTGEDRQVVAHHYNNNESSLYTAKRVPEEQLNKSNFVYKGAVVIETSDIYDKQGEIYQVI